MKVGKIIKERSRVYKGTSYYKYKINIPEVELVGSGLKAGDEVLISHKKDEITIRKKIIK